MSKEPFARIIPKPRPKTPFSVNFLFYFAILLVIISIGGFFFLASQISSLEEGREELGRQIVELEGEEEKKIEEEILFFREKIKIFKEIFTNHKISSNFLSLLESSSHQKVQLTSLNLVTENGRVSLQGKTESFQTLGEQFLIFSENEKIEDLILSNISLDKKGKINFSLTFSLLLEVFKK